MNEIGDIFESGQVVHKPSPLRLLRNNADGGGKQADDGRGKGHLHIISHRGDVALGQADQSRPHRDERAHQTEHRAHLSQRLRRIEFLLHEQFVVGNQPLHFGRLIAMLQDGQERADDRSCRIVWKLFGYGIQALRR